MCLTTKVINPRLSFEDKKKYVLPAVIEIAREDLKFYKRFVKRCGDLVTPYRGFKWPGYELVRVSSFGTANTHGNALDVNQGLHCYTKYKPGRYAVIIPKGTKFIRNADDNEVVALAMRLATVKERKKVSRKK